MTNLIQTPMPPFEELRGSSPMMSRKQIVLAICEQVLAQAEAEPPVDVELIASVCGIARVEYREIGPSGMLFCEDGQWVASVLGEEGRERQRFTVLHEAGHTLQPDFNPQKRYHRCAGPKSTTEQLCDLAAAEMLMPRSFFRFDLREHGVSLGSVEKLARRYRSSIESTARRTIDLHDDQAGLLVFELAHKPSEQGQESSCERRLRLQYAYSKRYLPFPRRHKSADWDSALGRVWEGENIEEVSDVDDYFAEQLGPIHLSARRYGDKVLGIVQPA
jgi:IrrE N-terminal-like domain